MSIIDLGHLYFGPGNAKIPDAATFSLPAGYTCPGAHSCLAKFDRVKRRLVDGPHQRFRCFAASMEAARPSLRVSVDRNFALLRAAGTTARMAAAIDRSLPGKMWKRIRIHVDGDYFNQDYMLAWIEVARKNPDRLFYGYTKSLEFWVALRKLIPDNMVLNASWGGRFDHLIEKHNLPNARVLFHPDEAEALGLPIDHDDSLAADPSVQNYALILHGPQSSGSDAAKALKRLRNEKYKYSYSRAR